MCIYIYYIYTYVSVCVIRCKHNYMKKKTYIYTYPTHHPKLVASVHRLVVLLQGMQPRAHVLKHLVSLTDVGFEAFLLQLLDVVLVSR